MFSQLTHQLSGNHVENGTHNGQPDMDTSFLSGIKQRLLSFIFRGIWNEETDKISVGLFENIIKSIISFVVICNLMIKRSLDHILSMQFSWTVYSRHCWGGMML